MVEESCLASDPSQTQLRPNILLVLLGICSHLARAAQHLLSRLLTGSELSSGICSVLSGCPPRPFPQVGKVGKPPSGEEHQDNGIPRFGALWKHSFLSVSAGLSKEGFPPKKSNREDGLVAQGISSKVSLVNAPSLKLSSLKTKLHQLDIYTK